MTHNSKTRIMLFGTFDILHKGHLNFFKQARGLAKNPYLIVSVARDVNVQKIKGRKPLFNEKRRLKTIKKSKLVDKAVLGSLKGYLGHIIQQRPSIIALGYDQKAYIQGLKQKLSAGGLRVKVIRLKAFKPKIYKSSLAKRAKKFDKI
jgi:FAD synthetase